MDPLSNNESDANYGYKNNMIKNFPFFEEKKKKKGGEMLEVSTGSAGLVFLSCKNH